MVVYELVLEVTRRCNMSCEHCLRGDAQNFDMTKEMVDEIFESIDNIGTIIFTGGEPLLNVEIIAYALEVVKKKQISVSSFFLATNGKHFEERYIQVLNDWMFYCLTNYYGVGSLLEPVDIMKSSEDFFNYASVSVSRDRYHEPIPIENYLRYRMLAYYSDCKEHEEPESDYYLINEGNAFFNGIGTVERKPYFIGGSADFIQTHDGIKTENIELSGILYISAIGEVLGDCDCSYETQKEINIGNIKEEKLLNIISDYLIEQNKEILAS